MKKTAADDQDDTIDEALRLRRALIRSGKCKLASGDVIQPKEDTLIRLIHDVAKLKPPKKRAITSIDGFRLQKTAKGGEHHPTADSATRHPGVHSTPGSRASDDTTRGSI